MPASFIPFVPSAEDDDDRSKMAFYVPTDPNHPNDNQGKIYIRRYSLDDESNYELALRFYKSLLELFNMKRLPATDEGAATRFTPVSYTHLTLPTIA